MSIQNLVSAEAAAHAKLIALLAKRTGTEDLDLEAEIDLAYAKWLDADSRLARAEDDREAAARWGRDE